MTAALFLSCVVATAVTPCSLSSDDFPLSIRFNARGIESIMATSLAVPIGVHQDDFSLIIDNSTVSSALLPDPVQLVSNSTKCGLRFTSASHHIEIDVYYKSGVTPYVSKVLQLRHTGASGATRNLSAVAPFSELSLDCTSPNTTTVVSSHFGLKDYAAFMRCTQPAGKPTAAGVLLTAQNPYLDINSTHEGTARCATAEGEPRHLVTIGYAPLLMWRTNSTLRTDSSIIGVYRLSGRTLAPPADPIDEADHAAMVELLSSYRAHVQPPDATTKINIGWTENDYQLDISLPADRVTYKRLIDRAAQFGITHLLFAPRNSDVSSKRNNTDAWGWEQILWFGMGQRLRMGTWKPGNPLPPSLVEMLAHFAKRNVRPVAYVYPILAFLRGTGTNGTSPPWIVPGTYELAHATGARTPLDLGSGHAQHDNGPWRSCLASPELQAWLPATMLAFARATGAGGFSFDYTYFEQHGAFPTFYASQYAQWTGWRAILAALQADVSACAGAQCVVDNRQQNHAWGPWMWVQGGAYAEPLMSDEQPGSWMFYEADLHTDRLSANRQRQVAWSYRQKEFCPAESLPGFAFHQTDRDVTPKQRAICGDGRCSNASRARDFDLLGYRYSLLSSIGTGGLNNVLCYLPARDEQEFSLLPREDIAFVQRWMGWTDKNVLLLRRTKVLPGLSLPSFGALDGPRGYIFLFNPSSRELTYPATLDATLGVLCPPQAPTDTTDAIDREGGGTTDTGPYPGTFLLVDLFESSEASVSAALLNGSTAPLHLGLVACGETINITVPPTTALVVKFGMYNPPVAALNSKNPSVLLLGSPANTSTYDDATGEVLLDGLRGETGAAANLTAVLLLNPKREPPNVARVLINGKPTAFTMGVVGGQPAVHVRGVWGRTPRFARNQELCHADAAVESSGTWSCTFTVPSAAFAQLRARNVSFPLSYDLDPRSTNDANTPWLAPGRLLIWVKYRALLNSSLNVSGTLNGERLLVRKAYNTIVPSPARFIGHFIDATEHVRPDAPQTLSLHLPSHSVWTARRGAIAAGGDLAKLNGTVHEAQAACTAREECAGLTFRKPAAVATCDAAQAGAVAVTAYLKLSSSGNSDPEWCTVAPPARLVGVFVENVESLHSAELKE